MDQEPLPAAFLVDDASLQERWLALRLNVQACYERSAVAEGRSEIGRVDELVWTYSQLTIPSEESLRDGRQIDVILDWYRRQNPLHGVICWYLHPTPPRQLGARLFARGASPNWLPHWMWCELRNLVADRPHAASFDIRVIEDEGAGDDEADPYFNSLKRLHPSHFWRIAAFQQGQRVGGCILNVTTGVWGMGGLFDMWVKPEARKQGIGTALAQVACELALQLGCRHVVLNATEMGKPVYQRVGFQSMGYGYSWYLREEALAQPAPASETVTFLEAIGLGAVETLDKIGRNFSLAQLQEPTINGLTPLEIAVCCQQPASADWLVAHGVNLDIISAWDFGWKERVSALLTEHPELVNQRGGEWDATPLHIAIERDDLELAKLLLTVPNDLECKDGMFQSTPLGWARHFQRPAFIALLEQAHKQLESW